MIVAQSRGNEILRLIISQAESPTGNGCGNQFDRVMIFERENPLIEDFSSWKTWYGLHSFLKNFTQESMTVLRLLSPCMMHASWSFQPPPIPFLLAYSTCSGYTQSFRIKAVVFIERRKPVEQRQQTTARTGRLCLNAGRSARDRSVWRLDLVLSALRARPAADWWFLDMALITGTSCWSLNRCHIKRLSSQNPGLYCFC